MINEKLGVLTEKTETMVFVETLKIKDFFNKIIKEGGSYEIKTPEGFEPIGDLYLKMEKKIFSIKLDTGEELIASEDHLIETETRTFNEDSEIVCYSSNDELVSKYKFYIKNDILRKKIAVAGQKKVFSTNNSLTDRLEQILKKIN